jgi:hypothetical protein
LFKPVNVAANAAVFLSAQSAQREATKYRIAFAARRVQPDRFGGQDGWVVLLQQDAKAKVQWLGEDG